jgi:hypothetical protein
MEKAIYIFYDSFTNDDASFVMRVGILPLMLLPMLAFDANCDSRCQ